MSLREYIEARCIPVPFAGCWMWLLSFGSHGYGNATMPGQRVNTAHRVSFLAFKGDIPSGMLVQHSCDNRWCVNPDHLSLGTDKTNSDDKHRKGRAGLERRVLPPARNRLFTSAQVAAIRASRESCVRIARRFGVKPCTIAAIRRGHGYADAASAEPDLMPLLPDEIADVNAALESAHPHPKVCTP